MTDDRQSDSGFVIEPDNLPIINENQTEPEEEHIEGISPKKWAILGGILALSSSAAYTFYGLLIKAFQLDFVDILFVRSMLQLPLTIAFVKLRGKTLLPEFAEHATRGEKIKKYSVLIGSGILAGMNMMCSYLGVLYIPLGDALTIIYTGPMFTMIFSFLFLRIRQGLWKISFTSLLIPGIILVVRPPFLFPNSDATNGTSVQYLTHWQYHHNNETLLSNDLSLNDDNIHWIGVGICFAAAVIGGLINVSINYLKDVDSGTVMFWMGAISILCSFVFNSFDHNSQIFHLKSIDSTTVGKLFALSIVGICANWMATGSYQLMDPTICAVLRAQEVLMGYIAQAIALHVVPFYLTFVGAGFVLLSAICTPLEKYVKPHLPERLKLIC